MKICILGFSGSGKSTLASILGQRYNMPVLHLDSVHWLPNWQERDVESGRLIVSKFMEQASWIIDGNYSRYCFKERLDQADYLIYLGFNRWNCLYRIGKRFIKHRGQNRPDMGEGCNEKIDLDFAWWILHKGRDRKHKQAHQAYLNRYREKAIILRNQRELDAFLTKPFLFIAHENEFE